MVMYIQDGNKVYGFGGHNGSAPFNGIQTITFHDPMVLAYLRKDDVFYCDITAYTDTGDTIPATTQYTAQEDCRVYANGVVGFGWVRRARTFGRYPIGWM